MRARKVSPKLFLILAASIALMFMRCRAADAAPVIAAYQEIYRMNFEVAEYAGLPPGWFATGDGYAVAQVRTNHWVYGRSPYPGNIEFTDVAVGSVVPTSLPYLARMPVGTITQTGSAVMYGTEKFQSIAAAGYDNMGVLDDPMAYTPVVWGTNKFGLMVWLGDKWYKITPRGGQTNSDALWSRHDFIVRTLKKKNALWSGAETEELADLAREWGFLWHGYIYYKYLRGPYDGGPDGDGDGDGWRDSIDRTPSAPPSDGNQGGGNWDTGRDTGSGTGTGNGSGGNWDR